MAHNLTVTVEDDLWTEMRKHEEIRWGAVMKEAAKEKLKALLVLERLSSKSRLTEKDIKKMSVDLGKEIVGRK